MPQSTFETYLRKEIHDIATSSATAATDKKSYVNTFYGYDVVQVHQHPITNTLELSIKLTSTAESFNKTIATTTTTTTTTTTNDSNTSAILRPKYLIGADGSNSFIRKFCHIDMVGQSNMQELLNVHFTCIGLRDLLKPRPAMLYFVFNEVS